MDKLYLGKVLRGVFIYISNGLKPNVILFPNCTAIVSVVLDPNLPADILNDDLKKIKQ